MPSRRSVSETTHALKSNRRMHRDEHAASSDDDVGPVTRQSWVVHPVDETLGRERAVHVFSRFLRQHELVDRVPVVARQADLDRRDGGDRAAGADHRAGLGDGGDLAEHVVEIRVDERDRVRQLLRCGRVGAELLLRQAHAAHRNGHRGVGGGELRRSSPDVEEQERAQVGIELARRAGVGEPPLVVAAQHLERRPHDLRRRVDERGRRPSPRARLASQRRAPREPREPRSGLGTPRAPRACA